MRPTRVQRVLEEFPGFGADSEVLVLACRPAGTVRPLAVGR